MMKAVIVVLIVLLGVLHHDFWWWDDARPLVLGFIPVSLAWHMGLSVATALVWLLVVTLAWPAGLDDDAGARRPEGRDPR